SDASCPPPARRRRSAAAPSAPALLRSPDLLPPVRFSPAATSARTLLLCPRVLAAFLACARPSGCGRVRLSDEANEVEMRSTTLKQFPMTAVMAGLIAVGAISLPALADNPKSAAP